jgi:hypothetical protein
LIPPRLQAPKGKNTIQSKSFGVISCPEAGEYPVFFFSGEEIQELIFRAE